MGTIYTQSIDRGAAHYVNGNAAKVVKIDEFPRRHQGLCGRGRTSSRVKRRAAKVVLWHTMSPAVGIATECQKWRFSYTLNHSGRAPPSPRSVPIRHNRDTKIGDSPGYKTGYGAVKKWLNPRSFRLCGNSNHSRLPLGTALISLRTTSFLGTPPRGAATISWYTTGPPTVHNGSSRNGKTAVFL
jgi:hypothetical protein